MNTQEKQDLARLISSGQARMLRKVAGLSQDRMGMECGVSGEAICRWERGRSSGRSPTGVAQYYEILCRLRSRYGTVTLAVAESD